MRALRGKVQTASAATTSVKDEKWGDQVVGESGDLCKGSHGSTQGLCIQLGASQNYIFSKSWGKESANYLRKKSRLACFGMGFEKTRSTSKEYLMRASLPPVEMYITAT